MRRGCALFGGSFDPIHFGHLSLLFDVWETVPLEKIEIVPAYCSPHKEKTPPRASAADRLKMVELALLRIPLPWSASSKEVEREGLSYTIDTLRQCRKEKEGKWYFILSEELVEEFSRWKEPDEILSCASPLVISSPKKKKPSRLPHSWQALFKRGSIPSRQMAISSTDVRSRLRQGLCEEHMEPQKKKQYINTQRLY